MDESPTSLVLIVDFSSFSWNTASFSSTCLFDSLLSLISLYFNLNHQNKICVIFVSSSDCPTIYSSPTYYSTLTELDQISRSFRSFSTTPFQPSNPSFHVLTSALLKSLLWLTKESSTMNYSKQIAVLSLNDSPPSSSSSSFADLFSVAFSAKKLNIPIDVTCIGTLLYPLQQISFISNGSLFTLPLGECSTPSILSTSVLSLLSLSALVPAHIRSTVPVNQVSTVDLRAYCSCHSNLIDLGFICTNCLSIACKQGPFCPSCKSRISLIR
ncbi:hypothetical protein RCL1_001401 [Eukaryota sp. TZLM3-RCL]